MIPFVVIGLVTLPFFLKGLADNRKIAKKLQDARYSNHPYNDLYDSDLDYLGNLGLNEGSAIIQVRCPAKQCWVNQKDWRANLRCPQCEDNDQLTAIKFQRLAELQDAKVEMERNAYRLEEWFWEEQIMMPETLIWCNGYPLEPLDPKDLKKFMEIKNQAYLKGDYNSVPLDEGGTELLEIDWLRLKGCSHDGAVKLLEMGVKPWEFDW